MNNTDHGDLHDYHSGDYIRPATAEERQASDDAASIDGGCGVILIDDGGRVISADSPGAADAMRCYVDA